MLKRIFVVSILLVSLGFAADKVTLDKDTHGLIMVDKQGALVRFFDPANFKEISTLTITGTPHELAMSPDGKFAYVPDYGDGVYGRNPNPGHSIAVIDLASRTVAATIDLSPYQAPHGLQVDAKGMLYATCDLSRKLLVIDTKRMKVLDAVDTEGTGHWVAVLPDGSKAYVANKNDRPFVSVIDLKARKMIGKVSMPKGTQGINASPDGKRVLAFDFVDPRIAVIDTKTDRVVQEITLEGQAKGAWGAKYSPDGKQVIVISVNDRSATIIDAADLTGKQTTLRVGSQPFGIAYTSDSRRALVSNHGDGSVSVLDLQRKELTSSFQAGKGIESLAYF